MPSEALFSSSLELSSMCCWRGRPDGRPECPRPLFALPEPCGLPRLRLPCPTPTTDDPSGATVVVVVVVVEAFVVVAPAVAAVAAAVAPAAVNAGFTDNFAVEGDETEDVERAEMKAARDVGDVTALALTTFTGCLRSVRVKHAGSTRRTFAHASTSGMGISGIPLASKSWSPTNTPARAA